jgi:hypothetical protein
MEARRTTFPTGTLFLVFVALLITVVIFATGIMPQVEIPSFTDHAIDRHAAEISNAVTCFNGYGTISSTMMKNPDTKRSAWMCKMDNEIFIWITDEAGKTVTMFKNKAKVFEDAIRYLTNRGYLP